MPLLDLRAILTKARDFIAFIAPVTPIKTDDELPGLIDAILADANLFGWFAGKVADSEAGTLSLESTPPMALKLTLEQRKIDWSRLVDLLPVIIQVVGLFRG